MILSSDFLEYAELRFPGRIEEVPGVLRRLRTYCQSRGLSETDWISLELATAEALNNAVEHGCAERPEAEIFLRCAWLGEVLRLEILDPGLYLPPTKPATLPEDLLAEGGRGAFLMAQLTDRVEHVQEAAGHRLILEKKTGPAIDPAHVEMDLTLNAMAEELERCYEVISALFRFSEQLAGAASMADFLPRSLGRLLTLVSGDKAVARFLNVEQNTLGLAGTAPEGDSAWPEQLAAGHNAVEVQAAMKGLTFTLESCWSLPAEDPLHGRQLGAYVCPIVFQSKVLGSLAVTQAAGATYFSAGDMNVIRYVADFIGIVQATYQLQEQRQKEQRALRELEIASSIQQALLPRSFPVVRGYHTGGLCLSARQVGGDYFSILPLAEDNLLLVIADVMGKGVPAAFLATVFRTAVHARLDLAATPGKLLSEVNQQVSKDLARLEMFITAQIGFLNPQRHTCTLASAGHCPLLQFQASTATVLQHRTDGIPLGILDELQYDEITFKVGVGDRLLMLTDGLYEVENAERKMLDLEGFIVEYQRQCLLPPVPGADETSALLHYVRQYGGDRPAPDDQTLLLLRREQ